MQSLSSGSSRSAGESQTHKQIVMISCDRCHNINPKRHNREGRGLPEGMRNELEVERWLPSLTGRFGGVGCTIRIQNNILEGASICLKVLEGYKNMMCLGN